MKNRYILTDLEKYVVFTDVNDRDVLYAITKEEQQKKMEILSKYNFKEEDVPAEYLVKAYRMGQVANKFPNYENWDIVNTTPFDFPINRMYWTWIQSIPTF